jgi:hypothetical protein
MGFEYGGIVGLLILAADIWAILNVFQSGASNGLRWYGRWSSSSCPCLDSRYGSFSGRAARVLDARSDKCAGAHCNRGSIAPLPVQTRTPLDKASIGALFEAKSPLSA